MKVEATAIPDVKVIEARVFRDARGEFEELWHADRFAGHGLDVRFVQVNHSRSVRGTLRGLHYQIERAQGKLVSVLTGAIFDVAVDLRRSSPTFGRWVGVELSEENHRSVWVPPGFAHGFYVTTDRADVVYQCTDRYAPEYERTLRWDDPDLAIAWPLQGPPLLSAKDAAGAAFAETAVFA